jgi:dipeptidase E
MKLLLTSNGFTSRALDRALASLLDKPVDTARVVFVMTAANPMPGDKSWLVDDLRGVKRQGFASMDVVDISSVDSSLYSKSLEAADVIVFGGGNSYYLMDHLESSGVAEKLPGLLGERVYVGISAGSIVAGPDLLVSSHSKSWNSAGEDPHRPGLGLCDVRLRPHLNNPRFADVTKERVTELATKTSSVIWAVDDYSALQVEDGNVQPVGAGDCVEVR